MFIESYKEIDNALSGTESSLKAIPSVYNRL